MTRLVGLSEIVTTMDYHSDATFVDKGTLIYGDMGGCVHRIACLFSDHSFSFINVLQFNAASSQLFNDALSPWDDGITVHLKTIHDTRPNTQSVVAYSRHRVRASMH